MVDPDRQAIVERDRARKALRNAVRSEIEQARHDLHPRTLTSRWADRQRAKLAEAGKAAKQNVTKNAPAIGIGTAAILLFAARKPIWNLIERLRNRRLTSEDEEQ